jgi:GTP-binding protein LepA
MVRAVIELHNPADMPDVVKIDTIAEPWIKATILVPDEYLGGVLKLCEDRRGVQKELTYVGQPRHAGLRAAAQRGGV